MLRSWIQRLRGRRLQAAIALGPANVSLSEGDRRVLLRLLAKLSNRRILFDPLATENYTLVVRSIGEMRAELAEALGELAEKSEGRAAVHRMLTRHRPRTARWNRLASLR